MKANNQMSFGQAIDALKDGHCLQREGWNGKGMFIVKQIPCAIQGLMPVDCETRTGISLVRTLKALKSWSVK